MGERQVLQLIKVIPLGDRWMGTIELDGNRLKVGVDEGRFGNQMIRASNFLFPLVGLPMGGSMPVYLQKGGVEWTQEVTR